MGQRSQLVQQYFVYGVFVLSLWFTIADVVPLSASFVLLLPLVPFALAQNPSAPRCIIALLALYAYFIASTLLYAPTSFLQPEFYRRDGNFFATMMPLVLGGIFVFHTDVERVMMAFLKWVTMWNAIFMVVFALTGGTLVVPTEPGIYHMLFLAHNAAGGFLAMVDAFALGVFFAGKKSLVTATIVIINCAGLVLTKSRGSEFGLIMAVLVVLIMRERLIKTTIAGVAIATALVLSFTYPAWLLLGKPLWESDTPFAAASGAIVNATFLDRIMFLWPRAIYLFLKSPIFGTGFGSYNDIPYRLVGVSHVLVYNRPYKLIFNSAHAHNTFLMVLAETGLVGLGLLSIFLYYLWKYIDSLDSSSFRLAMKLGFWVAVYSSLTEHRLFTPAEMFPFTLMLGIALAGRWDQVAVISGAVSSPVDAPG